MILDIIILIIGLGIGYVFGVVHTIYVHYKFVGKHQNCPVLINNSTDNESIDRNHG